MDQATLTRNLVLLRAKAASLMRTLLVKRLFAWVSVFVCLCLSEFQSWYPCLSLFLLMLGSPQSQATSLMRTLLVKRLFAWGSFFICLRLSFSFLVSLSVCLFLTMLGSPQSLATSLMRALLVKRLFAWVSIEYICLSMSFWVSLSLRLSFSQCSVLLRAREEGYLSVCVLS